MQIVLENGAVLDDSNIVEESMSLQESLCSNSDLRFGSCEASVFKIRLIEQFLPISGQKMVASISYAGVDTELGRYKVDSDKPTADRRYRDIVAYDAMYDIINADVAEWFNTILPDEDSSVTLKEFRTSFLEYFGIEQEDVELINDDMPVTRTIAPVQLSSRTVITAICEINGCFGHIGRDGKFQYIFLKEMTEGLYPSDTLYPSDDLYPADPMNAEQISRNQYISATYEDFTTAKINKLQIRQEENDIGYIYGDGDNCYIVQDNFLVYGKSTEELKSIATNLYSIICKVWYRPAHVEAKGNPCLEVGDGIKLSTTYEIVYTYILQRTLKGIQALRDTYDSEGEQYQREEVNSTHKQIIQLKGKSNVLERTIEQTRLTIEDVEKGLQSQITMNASSIVSEVARAKKAEGDLASRITQTADELRLEVTERTSMYNEEVNTLQGGMDGSINLAFFNITDGTVVTTINGKQCIHGGYSFSQDVSIPAGTYLFSFEWLRNIGLYINAPVALYDMSIPSQPVELFYENLGVAWPEMDVWHGEKLQFTLEKTTRVRFEALFWVDEGYEDRTNSLYLTNIALYGTAQSMSDAITDMKAQLIIQSNQIETKVAKNNIVSEINQTAEAITIKAEKIDLDGLVNANEFTGRYATISTLNATSASLQNLIAQKASIDSLNAVNASVQSLSANKADVSSLNALSASINSLSVNKLDASQFTASNISALGITVDSARVNGGFDASRITSGTISASRIDVSGLINSNTFRGAAITVQALYALSGITVRGTAVSWKTINVINSSGRTVTLTYLGA